jgi:hypothetical protein
MFLNMLDVDEKRAFTQLAEKMIDADGVVVGREAAVLASLKAEMGVAGGGDESRSVEEIAKVFRDRRSRVVALLELFGLAYSDTSFDMNEQSLIAEVAGHMGFTMDELGEIEQWVKDHVALIRRAMTLMR